MARFDDLPEAVIVTDAHHVIVSANAKAAAVLGYSGDELVGWPLERVFPKTPRGLSGLLAGIGESLSFEVRAQCRDGKRLPLGFVAAPLLRRGQVVGIAYVGRDVRVQNLLATEVRRSRDLFRSVIEHAPYGICVTDVERRVVMANRLAADIVGRSVDDLIGSSVADYYPSDYRLESLDLSALKRNRPLTFQGRFRRGDGSEVPVQANYAMFRSAAAHDSLIVESYSDLTDRFRVDQLKNEFVFVAAHELRNPVTAIRLLLDIICEDRRLNVDPVMRGYLDKLQEANRRLLQLVDDLLEVSRTEAGRLKIQVAPQNLVAAVETIVAEQRPSALTKSIILHYRPERGLPPVIADESKLKEIIANLISNAIKYNIDGGQVEITHELKGQEVITHVRDTGIGISAEDQARLFKKFWRSEDMAVRAQGGTGLGLFIVKELVERMGGRVGVVSGRGQGSTFSFSLPKAK